MRSRVMPGSSPTMARREPARRLKSVDLPTLGRPTMAMVGTRGEAVSVAVAGLDKVSVNGFPDGRGRLSLHSEDAPSLHSEDGRRYIPGVGIIETQCGPPPSARLPPRLLARQCLRTTWRRAISRSTSFFLPEEFSR